MLRDIANRNLRNGEERTRGYWRTGAWFLCLCIACGIPSFAPELSGFASTVLLYVLLAMGPSLELRLAGLPDFNYASWFAIGAYSDGLMARYAGLPFWACMPFAIFLAAFGAILVASPLLRWRIELFALVTLGLGVALQNVLTHWAPSPVLFPPISPNLEYWSLVLSTVVAALVWHRVRCSPMARLLRAARQDEIACRSIGVDIRFCRLAVVSIGAGIAGAAGCLFAAGQGSVRPADFDFSITAVLFAIAVAGGRHGQIGVIVAAIAVAAILGLFPAASNYRLLIAGTVLIFWAIRQAIPKAHVPQAEHSVEIMTPAEIGAE